MNELHVDEKSRFVATEIELLAVLIEALMYIFGLGLDDGLAWTGLDWTGLGRALTSKLSIFSFFSFAITKTRQTTVLFI